jgi:hypothetical protein
VEEVYKGFEGFKALLKNTLDEAIERGELPRDLDSSTVTDMLFTGMLGASVLYGVNKSTYTLDRSINSLIEYLFLLGDKEVINHSSFS